MSVTININGLSLCHKGSNGIATATVPDVCNTPSPGGPVPVPYPNIAFSSDLAMGTTTVTADGGNMCAIYGSEFSKSTGDEPGTVGGVKSGTFVKEATWITYSFDVKFEGEGACRLTDKMLMNHGNTVCLGGLVQQFLVLGYLYVLCRLLCECINEGNPHQSCVRDKLDEADKSAAGASPVKAEVPFDMRQSPPAPLPREWSGTDYQNVRIGLKGGTTPGGQAGSDFPDLGSIARGNIRVPDVTIVNDPTQPPSFKNLVALAEMKMPGDASFENTKVKAQIIDYLKIAQGNNISAKVFKLDAKTCGCQPGESEPVLVPELQKENDLLKQQPAQQVAPPIVVLPGWVPVVAGIALAAAGLALIATGVGAPEGTEAEVAGWTLLRGAFQF
jgi:hypothetical protein